MNTDIQKLKEAALATAPDVTAFEPLGKPDAYSKEALASIVDQLCAAVERAQAEAQKLRMEYISAFGQLQEAASKHPNADCSGDPANCPDNEGYGCACDSMNQAAQAAPQVAVPAEWREALRVAADAMSIASDWNLYDVQVNPPAEWGIRTDQEDASEGWASTNALATKFRAMLAAAPAAPSPINNTADLIYIIRGALADDLRPLHSPEWLARAEAAVAGMPSPSVGQQAFPPRDPTKPAEQQGLFEKFTVRRNDGSDAPGGKHHGCCYFVLDLDHDLHAGPAMRAYAVSCRATHPVLADDIEATWGREEIPGPVVGQDAADAARYRWMKKHLRLRPTGRTLLHALAFNGRPEYFIGHPDNHENVRVTHLREYEIVGLATMDESVLADLDSAIDAAINSKKGGV